MDALGRLRQIDPVETQMVEVLRNRYGDGNIYLPQGVSRQVLAKAVELGYLSEEGYVTRKGRMLLARHHQDGM